MLVRPRVKRQAWLVRQISPYRPFILHFNFIYLPFSGCGICRLAKYVIIDVDSAFPCEILRPEQRKNIQYSNGIELAYLANEPQDAWLDLYFFWRYQYERDGTHAYSIQVFDAAGQKPQQAGFVQKAP